MKKYTDKTHTKMKINYEKIEEIAQQFYKKT